MADATMRELFKDQSRIKTSESGSSIPFIRINTAETKLPKCTEGIAIETLLTIPSLGVGAEPFIGKRPRGIHNQALLFVQ
ncbi:hypothetical protein HY29_03375 [Hyphomonas beringensis]|uniref:Uncharacterized protein n=1 Tax=Hyphomonas beringensis TaxID=1280946 RepID=A0A062UAW4_9PROT|nr:hypothetical protein HY29_03375 [Hyphomonas beringensis]